MHTELWAAPSSCMSVALASLTAASYGKEGKNSDPFWTGEETIAPKRYRACWSHPGAHIACLTSSSAVARGGTHALIHRQGGWARGCLHKAQA